MRAFSATTHIAINHVQLFVTVYVASRRVAPAGGGRDGQCERVPPARQHLKRCIAKNDYNKAVVRGTSARISAKESRAAETQIESAS